MVLATNWIFERIADIRWQVGIAAAAVSRRTGCSHGVELDHVGFFANC